MNCLDKDIQKLRKSLGEGSIQRAYRGIVSYMSRLQRVFADQRGDRAISGLYQGYFDMTYFALFSDGLKERDLKLAVVFNYESFNFEAWLAARNRKVQHRYWELLLNSGYKEYPLVEPAVGIDAIVSATLASEYSLEAEERLTAQIVEGVLAFERDILSYLSKVNAKQR
jgi:hypothetical protein